MVRRKDGRWQEQMTVTVNGRPTQKYFYGKTKAEINQKISEWKEKEAERRTKGTPFSVVADEWWEEEAEDLSDNTKRPYKAAFNRAREHFGNQPIQNITPAEIASYVRTAARRNKMSDKTAKTQLSVINMIFRYAVRRGEIPFNPARDLEVPKDLPKSTREVPADAEINAIRSAWDTAAGQMANWFLYTGLRRNELLALTWEDVDMEARTITVSKSIYRGMDGKTHLKEPKTEAGVRTVPLLDALAKHLIPGKGLIFSNRYGTYITDAQFEKLWRDFQSETGVACTPHQLRHATVTMYCEAVDDGKLSLQDVQHIVGHANYQTTMNIYNHYRKLREEKARAAVLDLDYKTSSM